MFSNRGWRLLLYVLIFFALAGIFGFATMNVEGQEINRINIPLMTQGEIPLVPGQRYDLPAPNPNPTNVKIFHGVTPTGTFCTDGSFIWVSVAEWNGGRPNREFGQGFFKTRFNMDGTITTEDITFDRTIYGRGSILVGPDQDPYYLGHDGDQIPGVVLINLSHLCTALNPWSY